MAPIPFSRNERQALERQLKDFLREELECEITALGATLLLDHIVEKAGSYFYNRGLYDAQALLSKRVDQIGEAILDLEQPTDASG